MKGRRALVLACTVVALAPWLPAAACPGAAEGYQRVATEQAEIAYRWQPLPKVGRFSSIDVVACRAPGTDAVQDVIVDALMPAHGHGMNYRPTAEATGPGSFRVSGVMLHMPGHWRLTVDLVQGTRRTRLTHDVDLAP